MVVALFFAIGFTPIATLAASLLEIVSLHRAAPATITAAVTLGIYLVILLPGERHVVLRGLLAGTAAVAIYDCTRLPFVLLGDWPDFIPSIGQWLLDDPGAHWSVGYLWRYLGNGAGMGLAFTVLAPSAARWVDPRRAGVAFGLAVWTGLLLTLALAPHGQDRMFVLTPAAFVLSLIGHVVYGGVLGLSASRPSDRPRSVTSRLSRPATRGGRGRRRPCRCRR